MEITNRRWEAQWGEDLLAARRCCSSSLSPLSQWRRKIAKPHPSTIARQTQACSLRAPRGRPRCGRRHLLRQRLGQPPHPLALKCLPAARTEGRSRLWPTTNRPDRIPSASTLARSPFSRRSSAGSKARNSPSGSKPRSENAADASLPARLPASAFHIPCSETHGAAF